MLPPPRLFSGGSFSIRLLSECSGPVAAGARTAPQKRGDIMDFPIEGENRDELARILEMVADEGLDEPHSLDAAIDAIASCFQVEELTLTVGKHSMSMLVVLESVEDTKDAK